MRDFLPKPCSLQGIFISLWWVYAKVLSAGEFLGLGAHSGAGSEDGAWGNASPGNMCAGKQGLHPSCLSGGCDKHGKNDIKKAFAKLSVCCLLCNWE